MIKIDIDSCIFVDGDARCEGTIKVTGDSDNLELEIYAILKTFEHECTGAYINALEKTMKELKGVEE